MRRNRLVVGAALVLGVVGCEKAFGLHQVGADDAGRGFAPIQQQTSSDPNATTLDVTFTTPPAAGHVIVMVGAAISDVLKRPTGGGVTSWQLAAQSYKHNNVEIWYGVTDGSSSTISIACTCTSVAEMWMSVSEWSGLSTTNLFEAGGSGDGLSGSAGAAPITLLDFPDLVVFAVTSRSTISTQVTGGPWTPLDSVSASSVTQDVWYQVTAGSGSIQPMTTALDVWDAAIAAFRMAP